MFLTIIPLTSEDITAMIGYATDIIGDLMPLLIVFIGIAIAGAIIRWFMDRRGN